MTDPIEAAWSAYAKAMDHTGPTVAEENAIRLAIAAHHAAAPSDYAELIKRLRTSVEYESTAFEAMINELCEEAADAIENLEALTQRRVR